MGKLLPCLEKLAGLFRAYWLIGIVNYGNMSRFKPSLFRRLKRLSARQCAGNHGQFGRCY